MAKGLSSALLGAAGEHLVLSRLLLKGVLASAAPPGFEKIDILVQPHQTKGPSSVQVKASLSGEKIGWWLRSHHEQIKDPGLIYCFVNFKPNEPVVYVIPSAVVAEKISTDHRLWLASPGAQGQARNDTDGRKLRASMLGAEADWLESYREHWEIFL